MLDITLCNKFKPSFTCGKKHDKEIEHVLSDINRMIADRSITSEGLLRYILTKLIQLTGSEYGLIGTVEQTETHPSIKLRLVSSLFWELASFKFHNEYKDDEVVLKKITRDSSLFCKAIQTKEPIINNKFSLSYSKVTPIGHPITRRCIIIPITIGGDANIIFCGCNALKPYKKKHIEAVKSILSILSYLFIDIMEL